MFIRISKAKAKALYQEDKPFYVVACNMRPEYAVLIDEHSFEQRVDTPFEVFLNYFIYYNCNNETGRYPAFYIED